MTLRVTIHLALEMQGLITGERGLAKSGRKQFWLNCRFLSAMFFLFSTAPTFAMSPTMNICDQAARKAAIETGVPLAILWSITRTETGRSQNGSFGPWPWTVNMEGAGHWFDTENAARTYVSKHFERGARSFDVGCFQINYKWHGASFRSIEHMFDPFENARYAAAFLKRLYDESGNWSAAAGAFHSRTPEYADRYKARFERFRMQYTEATDNHMHAAPRRRELSSAPSQPRQNNYPLLMHSSSSKSKGSLVPLSTGQATALFSLSGASEGS